MQQTGQPSLKSALSWRVCWQLLYQFRYLTKYRYCLLPRVSFPCLLAIDSLIVSPEILGIHALLSTIDPEAKVCYSVRLPASVG